MIVFERVVMMIIFGRNREEDGENNMMRNFIILLFARNIIRVINLNMMRQTGPYRAPGATRNLLKVFLLRNLKVRDRLSDVRVE
jgi:hypothetical protein